MATRAQTASAQPVAVPAYPADKNKTLDSPGHRSVLVAVAVTVTDSAPRTVVETLPLRAPPTPPCANLPLTIECLKRNAFTATLAGLPLTLSGARQPLDNPPDR